MLKSLQYWKPYLSFRYQDIRTISAEGRNLTFKSMIPVELFLQELKLASTPNNNLHIPCTNPAKCLPAVPALDLRKYTIQSTRSSFCRHVRKLVGYYKLVLNMQCIRLFFPVNPAAHVSPSSMARLNLTPKDVNFVRIFHNISGAQPKGWSLETISPLPDGAYVRDYDHDMKIYNSSMLIHL